MKGVTAVGNTRYNSWTYNDRTYRDILSAEHYEYEEGKEESWWFNYSGAVTIQVLSAEFTPMFFLYDSSGNMLAWDDNSGDLDHAGIAGFSLPAAGDYRIEVAAKNGGYGTYDVALNHPVSDYSWAQMSFGASIYNAGGSGDVTVSGLGSKGNTFSYNSWEGLYVYSAGAISVAKTSAELNEFYGLDLDNLSAAAARNITLVNASANSNGYYGVRAVSLGSILWNGGGATGNAGGGGSLANQTALTPKAVSVSNAGFFKNQDGHGLVVVSLGSITLTNVGASGNRGWGANGLNLDNCAWGGSACIGSGSISVTGTYAGEGANENENCGIYADSFGSILVRNSGASGNGDIGAVLYNNYTGSTGNVTVGGTALIPAAFSGNLNDSGLVIQSKGTIALSNVLAEDNLNGSGVNAQNDEAASAKTISLNRVFANDNRWDGVYAKSLGAITAGSIQTNGNLSNGIFLSNIGALSAQPITVTKSESKDNTGDGMNFEAAGKITLNALRSENNTGSGLYINTEMDLALLSSLGENNFNLNKGAGIYVHEAFNISLSKVTANDNNEPGLYIEDGQGAMTINTAAFQHNGHEGIVGYVDGDITINKVQITGNGLTIADGDGIRLITQPTSMVNILNSMVTGHQGSGIDLTGGSSLTLTGTYYLGNDTDNDAQPNVDWP